MASKTISFTLDPMEISRAIAEMEAYKRDFESKLRRVRELIGERIWWSAQNGFKSAVVSDVIAGPQVANDVTVTIEHNDDMTVIIADGEEAVFIEFGAGVYHNGAAGSSPHPWGAENGYMIGEYGKGQGKRNVWALPGSTKQSPNLTHGTPAAMPMYLGLMEGIKEIESIVRGVFG